MCYKFNKYKFCSESVKDMLYFYFEIWKLFLFYNGYGFLKEYFKISMSNMTIQWAKFKYLCKTVSIFCFRNIVSYANNNNNIIETCKWNKMHTIIAI